MSIKLKSKQFKRRQWTVNSPLHKNLNLLEIEIETLSKNMLEDLSTLSSNQSTDSRLDEFINEEYYPKVDEIEKTTSKHSEDIVEIKDEIDRINAGTNAYTKQESDERFLQKTETTVEIGNKKLTFDGEAKTKTGEVLHGKINISEDGLDVKSNHSVSVVVNEDNLGDGYFRVYTGSGRKPLLEVGERIFRYGEQAYRIYHEGFKPTTDEIGTYDKSTINLMLASSIKVSSVNGKTGNVIITKDDLGLSQVDNYSKEQIVSEARNGLSVQGHGHNASEIIQSSSFRFTTDLEKEKWNLKSDFSGDYEDLANKPVLFSGDYSDLSNTPTLFTWNYNDLLNKPVLFSGSYNDLSDKPTLFSGNYEDLNNKPVIPVVDVDKAYVDSNLDKKIDKTSIVNDLNTGGVDKVLSAEMGKFLKSMVESSGNSALFKNSPEKMVLDTVEGILPANTSEYLVSRGYLNNPKIFIDGERIPSSLFSFSKETGLISLSFSFEYETDIMVEDELPQYIKYVFDSENQLVNDSRLNSELNVGDIVVCLGSNEPHDGGYCKRIISLTAGLDALSLGDKYANFIDYKKIIATHTSDGSMSKEDKVKLDSIENNANNYSHPSSHDPAIIMQDSNNRFVSDSDKSRWDNKINSSDFDINSKGVLYSKRIYVAGDQNTFYPVLINLLSIRETDMVDLVINKHTHDFQNFDGHMKVIFVGLSSQNWGSHPNSINGVRLFGSWNKFLGGYKHTEHLGKNFVVWLKGGGRNYDINCNSNYVLENISVHYSTVEASGSQEGYDDYVSPITSSMLNEDYDFKNILINDIKYGYTEVHGYEKLPGGVVKQWGSVKDSNGTQTITLPTAFKNGNYKIATSLSYDDSTGISVDCTDHSIIVTSKTETSFMIGTGVSTRILGMDWIAIGY